MFQATHDYIIGKKIPESERRTESGLTVPNSDIVIDVFEVTSASTREVTPKRAITARRVAALRNAGILLPDREHYAIPRKMIVAEIED